MAYLGRTPAIGRYAKLDDIASSFNGSITTFNLTSGGDAQVVQTETQLIVSLGGIIQEPQTDYTVSGSTISFTTAPLSGDDYFAILLGDTFNVGVPSDNTLQNRHVKSDAAIAMSKLDGSSGTLSALTVDNVNINGNSIIATSGQLLLSPASGSQMFLDGTIGIDGGVVTGATSITSTAFVGALTGNVTGNASGTAATVTTAAQPAITSLGTLTALTVSGDISGGTINATGDTAADDNAAIGYTSAEGLILTGQGSTSDITLKNDADAIVFTVPTGTDDILFPDSAKAIFGAGSDGSIYSDGTNFTFVSTAERHYTDAFQVSNAGASETILTGAVNGAVNLYYDGSAKLTTASTGVTITGTATATTFVGALTGNADTFTATANDSTNEGVYLVFVDGQTGAQGAETDTGLIYNPSTGIITSTGYTGTLQTAAQTNITSLGTLSALTIEAPTWAANCLTLRSSTSGNTDYTGISFWNAGVQRANVYTDETGNWSVTTGVNLYLKTGSVGISGGTSRLTVLAAGNVGIGTTSPATRLHIKQSNNGETGGFKTERSDTTAYGVIYMGGDNDLYIQNQANGDINWYTNSAAKMTLKADGKLGIGTASPSEMLHIVNIADSSDSEMILETTTASTASRIHLKANNSAGAAYNTIGSLYGSTYMWRIGGTGTADVIDFQLGSGYTQTMRLNSTGLGIGTTAPAAQFHIYSTSAEPKIHIEDASSGAGRGGKVTGSWGGNGLRLDSIGAAGWVYVGGSNTSYIPFSIGSEKARFHNNGNFGIGTSAPATLLTLVKSAASAITETLRLSNSGGGAGSGSRITFHSPDAIFNAIDLVRPNGGSGGHIRFSTMNVAGSLTEKLRIDEAGNIIMPNVSSSTQTAFRPPYIDFQIAADNPGGVNKGIYWHSVAAGAVTRSYGALWREQSTGHFYIDSQTDIIFSPAAAEKMRIKVTTGYVGIGTTAPAAALDVTSGEIRMTDGRNLSWGGANCRIQGTNNGSFEIYTGGGPQLTVTNGGTVTGTDMIMQFPPTYPASGTSTTYQNGALTSADSSLVNSRVPCALKVTKMYLYVNGTLSTGSAVVTLMKDGVAQSSPIAVDTSGGAFDSTPNISFTVGQRIGIKVATSSTSAAWYHVTLLCERLA